MTRSQHGTGSSVRGVSVTALPLCLSLLPRTKTVAYADPTASPCGGAVAEGTECELVPADGSLEEVQALE